VGTVRRECLDSLLILDARHLQQALQEFADHYNRAHPHRSASLAGACSRSTSSPYACNSATALREDVRR
jgi:Integrase core domain